MVRTAPTRGYQWTLLMPLADLPVWPDWLAGFYREVQERRPGHNDVGSRRIMAPEHTDQAERYVARAILGITSEVAAAKPGCQETTLNGASFRTGRLCAAVPSLIVDIVVQQLIDAGLSMENEPGRRPWAHVDIEKIVRRGIDDGRRHGPAALPAFQT